MLKIPTRYLILVNGILWSAIGTKITLTGIGAYRRLPDVHWWYFLLSALVFAGFYVMFTGIVRKYAARIEAMPEPRTSIFKTFSVKGYIIIAFMITLGITLKHLPWIPDSFIAWFYCALLPCRTPEGGLVYGKPFLARSVHVEAFWCTIAVQNRIWYTREAFGVRKAVAFDAGIIGAWHSN